MLTPSVTLCFCHNGLDDNLSLRSDIVCFHLFYAHLKFYLGGCLLSFLKEVLKLVFKWLKLQINQLGSDISLRHVTSLSADFTAPQYRGQERSQSKVTVLVGSTPG